MADDATPPAEAPLEQDVPAAETLVEQTDSTGQTAQIPINEPLSEPQVEQNAGSTGRAIPEPTPQVEASASSEPAEPASEAAQESASASAEPGQSEPQEMPETEAPTSQPAARGAQPRVEQTGSTGQATPANPAPNTSPQAARELLVKARAKVQTQKQKRLDAIVAELEKKRRISNDYVQKLLRCSDATATRYLAELEKNGTIKQVGKTGKAVLYEKA